ncbi:MAG TPA: MarR family transcriptional regulator [Candidatus Dormibacteraeota bacterium]|jgi:DNA-binding MarR family transcriptional regulator|nr:MarR family transcriptional regulator [Candidatus Dormibacteraeota bacterium]
MNDSALAASPAREELLDQLLDLQPRMRQRFDALLPRGLCATFSSELGGVTQHQVEVLGTLVRRGRVTMHELAALLAVGPSSATQLVDRLINRELVERHTDPGDRRLVWIVATPRAQALTTQFAELKREIVRALAGGLTDDELTVLVGLLAKLADGPDPRVSTLLEARPL